MNDSLFWGVRRDGLNRTATIRFRVHEFSGGANAPGGGFEQIRNAYQAWSTVIGTTFRFHDAGFTSAQGFAFDGINAVSFGDPLGQIDPPQGCSGTLAIGGFFRSTNQTGWPMVKRFSGSLKEILYLPTAGRVAGFMKISTISPK